MKIVSGHKLFNDTYLFEVEGYKGKDCLMIAKVNTKGDIVRLTEFGEKRSTSRNKENEEA